MKIFVSALVSILGFLSLVNSQSLESDIHDDPSHLRGRVLKVYPPKGFTTDPLYNCSLTCAPCPIGCTQVSCSSKPVYLPPKAEFFPPVVALYKIHGPYPKARNITAEYLWWTTEVLAKYPKMIKQSDTKYALSEKEVTLVKMGLSEWMEARASGEYTCMDIATALTKRALYLQEVQKMQQFMYWGTFDWIKVVLKEAQRMDHRAAKKGTAAIAPLYCYPVPIKGTISTIDFPSSVGFPSLHTVKSKVDAAMITLLKKAKGVQFGKTNVPAMASGGNGISANWGNGITMNAWGHQFISASSSGGSGVAVASYLATIAITEDTGGSTLSPSTLNHNFGYDPPKFHYPNQGNPSLTVRNDQIGVNARSIDDIIAFDQAILGTQAAHAKAAAYVAGLSNSDIRIGCSDVNFNYSLMSPAIADKYNQVKNVLLTAGFTFVDTCAKKNPYTVVPSNYSNSVYIDELQYHITNNLKVNLSVFEVMTNGNFAFANHNPIGTRIPPGGSGCVNTGWNVNQTVIDEYLGRIPAARADVYNEYYNQYNVDLVMGPSGYCDFVTMADEIIVPATCNGTTIAAGGCYSKCMSAATRGSFDKVFSKAKFVVPIGLTSVGGHAALHFMSRAGPKRLANVSASTWVYDEEGPKTHNLEEMYMIKRIYNVLSAAGMKRADATINFISGLF